MIILPAGTLPDLTHPLMLGLVTWLPCNEVGGAHLNNFGNVYDPGTFVGYDESMWEGQAIKFNGTDQRVDFTPTSLADAFTMSFWYRMDSTPNQTLVGSNTHQYDYCLLYQSTKLYLRTTNAYKGGVPVPTEYQTGWHHFLAERNPGLVGGNMFIDGVVYYNWTNSLTGNLEADSLGAEPSDTSWFNGAIRDFRQWDRVLTEVERAELLKGTLTPLRRVATPVYTFGAGGGGGVNLVIADSAHGHTADNLVLTQAHQLAVSESTHAHAADNIALTQAHALAVVDSTHGHAADNIDLSVSQELAVAEATHGHASDNIDLTQAHQLAISESTHGHTAENIVLQAAGTLAVQDSLHGHIADDIALTQAHILAIAEAAHSHAADNLNLDSSAILTILDGAHGHTADNIALTQSYILSIQHALHNHAAENVGLEVDHATLIISDALHAHLADQCNVSEQITVIETPGERIFMIQADGRVIAVSAGPRAFPIQ